MLGAPLEAIITFVVIIVGLLALDLLIVGRNSHKIGLKEAGFWTAVFIAVSLAFAGFVYYDMGSQKALEFVNAYTIEKVLSVDNLFVFILIFSYFKVPEEYHHKVLFYGIIGAIVLRFIFIYLGVEMLALTVFNIYGFNVNILILAFGLFLAYVGIKSLKGDDDDEQDFNKSIGAKIARAIFPRITENYEGDRFFVKRYENNKWIRYGTPLLIVVAVIEFTDVLFAVDSIPAIFSVSNDPFILYTSNIFAILGLRSMYFLLSGLLPVFKYLGTGVSFILTFIGIKMIVSPILHVDSLISLTIIMGILITSVAASLFAFKRELEE